MIRVARPAEALITAPQALSDWSGAAKLLAASLKKVKLIRQDTMSSNIEPSRFKAEMEDLSGHEPRNVCSAYKMIP